jgi:hypothetical protein
MNRILISLSTEIEFLFIVKLFVILKLRILISLSTEIEFLFIVKLFVILNESNSYKPLHRD